MTGYPKTESKDEQKLDCWGQMSTWADTHLHGVQPLNHTAYLQSFIPAPCHHTAVVRGFDPMYGLNRSIMLLKDKNQGDT